MKCPRCGSEKTQVSSTEKGHRLTGRFYGLDKMKDLVEEWGESSVFRQRSCSSCSHKFETIVFASED